MSKILPLGSTCACLIFGAGLDIYTIETRPGIAFLGVPLSVLVSVWFLQSYNYHWNKLKDGKIRRHIFGAVPMYVGAQLLFLGTIVYPMCPSSIAPGPHEYTCILGYNFNLNYFGGALLLAGYIVWKLMEKEKSKSEESTISLPLEQSIATTPSQQQQASPVNVNVNVKGRMITSPFALGIIAGVGLSAFDWWLVVYSLSVIMVGLQVVGFFLIVVPFLIPAAFGLFTYGKYRSTRGLMSFMAAFFMTLIIAVIVFLLYAFMS